MANTGVQPPIALLVNILGSGGAQRRLAHIANSFVALDRAVDIVSVDPDGPMRSMLEPAVNVVTLLDAPANPRVSNAVHSRRLASYLRSRRPRVLMSCVTDTHLLAVAAHALCRTRGPLVLRASRHPYRPIAPNLLLKRLVEPVNIRKAAFCYSRADAIVALSKDNASGLRQLIGARPVPIEVIPNPVVTEIADAPLEARAAFVADPIPLILGIGRLVEQKDFATLIKGFARLHAQRPSRLVILGEGPLRGALAALADRLGVGDAVAMPGEVQNVSEWIANASLVVSSSLWEGLQSTLIEALALGCPVVATDCPGGARETLVDGELGPLVKPGDAAALAAAVATVLDAPRPPRLLASGAAPYTSEGKTAAYLALFDRLLEGQGTDGSTTQAGYG